MLEAKLRRDEVSARKQSAQILLRGVCLYSVSRGTIPKKDWHAMGMREAGAELARSRRPSRDWLVLAVAAWNALFRSDIPSTRSTAEKQRP